MAIQILFLHYTLQGKQIKQLTSWRINNDSKRTADILSMAIKMFEISKLELKV